MLASGYPSGGLRRAPRRAAVSTLLDVPTDGPGQIYVPADATDWTELGLATPSFMWPLQEASGNLAPTIGNALGALAPNASPLYQQTVTGWTRKGVATVDNTAGQRFGNINSVLDLAAGQSMAYLVYASVAAGAATRNFLGRLTNGNRVLSTGLIGTYHNGVSASSTGSVHADGAVHPFLWYRNATADTSGTFTDMRHTPGTHDESAIASTLWALGAISTNAPPTAQYLWAAMWIGASAESIASKATLTTLRWTVGY